MNLEKIISAFSAAFFTVLMPTTSAIISLFLLVFVNAIVKYFAVSNDEGHTILTFIKNVRVAQPISYIIYSIVGYSFAILTMTLMEVVFFGGASFQIGSQVVNLTYIAILFCISHVIGQIMNSVEDIVQHDVFEGVKNKMPKFMQEFFKQTKKRKKD